MDVLLFRILTRFNFVFMMKKEEKQLLRFVSIFYFSTCFDSKLDFSIQLDPTRVGSKQAHIILGCAESVSK